MRLRVLHFNEVVRLAPVYKLAVDADTHALNLSVDRSDRIECQGP